MSHGFNRSEISEGLMESVSQGNEGSNIIFPFACVSQFPRFIEEIETNDSPDDVDDGWYMR